MNRKASEVYDWRYEDGWYYIPGLMQSLDNTKIEKEFRSDLKGWHCSFYEADDDDILKWMEENMTGEYECRLRFNSGNPMFSIHICDNQDATLFKLTWI